MLWAYHPKFAARHRVNCSFDKRFRRKRCEKRRKSFGCDIFVNKKVLITVKQTPPGIAARCQIPLFVTYGDIFPRSGGSLSSKGEALAVPIKLMVLPRAPPLGELDAKRPERASCLINTKRPLALRQRARRVLSRSQQGPFHRPAQQPRASPHEWLLRSGPACR